MQSRDRRQLLGGFWVTSLGTLASRVLGLVRDMATAALLGMGESGVMDAFVVAFRIPNLFRRIFGEGALAASYMPVLVEKLERDRAAAWQLASVLMTWLTALLAILVLLGEAVCAAIWFSSAPGSERPLLVGLSAAMLPYLLFICLAAQLSATLQALGHFRLPAIAPALLNVCWLVGVWILAPRLATDKASQAYILSGCIVAAGVLQAAAQWPALRAFGFRFDYQWQESRDAVLRIAQSMGPLILGLAVTQLNTLFDSLIAWGLSAPPGDAGSVWWLGNVAYPMQAGAAAAIYYGERFYQLPMGMLGLAIATVIFPLLSRHAARDQRQQLGDDLALGLRLTWFSAFPAGVALMLLAEPLARLLLERGQFSADDTTRTAEMIVWFCSGVWAYCAGPVLVRGYYAMGDRSTPVKIGMLAMGFNLLLDVVLIWPLAESGLALATSAAAQLHVILLGIVFSRRYCPLPWSAIAASMWKTVVATATMSIAVALALALLPAGAGSTQEAVRLALAIAGGTALFVVTAWLLQAEELRWFLGRQPRETNV